MGQEKDSSDNSAEETSAGFEPVMPSIASGEVTALPNLQQHATHSFSMDPDATQGFDGPFFTNRDSRRVPAVPGYEILHELGRGGMGVVYAAKQIRADRIVALKMMLNVDHARAEERERFSAEVRAVARLQHPNIVGVYEVGEYAGAPYFTLEYVPSGTLAKRVSERLLSHQQSAEMMRTLAGGVDYAHSRGVIHRDLKPGNILIDEKGAPKIADFGLARRTEDASHLTREGTIVGTPSYMSPEQAFGSTDAIGPSADIYSLGAIMYELLVGRPPFQGATVWEVVQQVRHADPVPPTMLQPGVPKDLETICLKCLRKEPEKRYATAKELEEELQRFLNNEPILARPLGQFERLVRMCKRYPREARLIATVAGLVLSLLIVATAFAIKADSDRRQIALQNTQITRQAGEISDQNTLLRDQRDTIQKEKDVSDQRLKLYRTTVSQLVNRAPRLLESVPMAAELRTQFTGIIEQILRESSDTGEVGASKSWGQMATYLRRAESTADRARSLRKLSQEEEANALYAESIQLLDEALKMAESVYASDEPDRAKTASNLAIVLQRKAQCLYWSDPSAWQASVPLHRKAIEYAKEAADASHTDLTPRKQFEYQSNYGDSLYRYASFLLEIPGEDPRFLTRADELLKEAEQTQKSVIERGPTDREFAEDVRHRLALVLRSRASLSQRQGDTEASDAFFEEAIQNMESLVRESGNRNSFLQNLALTSNEYGDLLLYRRSDPSKIEKYYSKSLQAYHSMLLTPELRELEQDGLALQYYRLGLAAVRRGDGQQAKQYFTHCAAIRLKGYLDVLETLPIEERGQATHERIGLMLAQARAGMVDAVQEHAQDMNLMLDRNEIPESIIDRSHVLQACAAGLGILSQVVASDDAETGQKLRGEAKNHLLRAIASGYKERDYLMTDPDFEWISQSDDWNEIDRALQSE